jgi:AcrR family transcriptional regulator
MVHKIHRPHLSTAQDARAVRTREALRGALLSLLDSKPLEQISIRDIAAESGVGYTTFFRHHPTKESLLDDLAAEQIRHLIGLSLPVYEQAADARAAALTLCRYVAEHRPLWTTLLTGGAAAALREEFVRISREVAARAPSVGWPPAEIGIILVVSGTIELLAWWLRQDEPMTVEQIAEIHDRLVTSPTVAAGQTTAVKPARIVAKNQARRVSSQR